jgi:hypothetical protein
MIEPLFAVDVQGLVRLQAERPKANLLAELYQNAKDEEGVTEIAIRLETAPQAGEVLFTVVDDAPGGFRDLSHAFTLFAESHKLANPLQSGWMNVGEKFLIAACEEVTIVTTDGTIKFDVHSGTRKHLPKQKRPRGTCVMGRLKMTPEALAEARVFLGSILPPEGIKVFLDGRKLAERRALLVWPAKLPTRLTNDKGELTVRLRDTKIAVYPIQGQEVPHLYELGIPVVPIDSTWHVNIAQRVLLNKDRDNVTPAYLKQVLVEVLNHTHELLPKEDVNEGWVHEAAGDERCSTEAIKTVMTTRYGDRYCAASVQDPESNLKAVAEGYTVIHSRSLGAGERDNARRAGLLPVAHDLYPTAKPLSCQPGTRVDPLDPSEWTDGMQRVVRWSKFLAGNLLSHAIEVVLYKDLDEKCLAAYGERTLYFSVNALGRAWFDQNILRTTAINEVVLHELAHDKVAVHLSEDYHRELCRLGAALARLIAENPGAVLAIAS